MGFIATSKQLAYPNYVTAAIVILIMINEYLDSRRDEVTAEWRRLHNEELNVCTAHPILCG